MHLTHINLKPTQKHEKDFQIKDVVKDLEFPEESKRLSYDFYKSDKLSDELGYDLLIEFEDSIIYAFDFLSNGEKLIIPELNPTIIFYSNAVMFHRNLMESKRTLIEKSPSTKDIQKIVDPKIFGGFFQFATNCLINLQSTLESFANRQIPEDYLYIDRNGDKFEPSVFHKIDKALPKIKDKKFKSKFRNQNNIIRRLIELRNEIIHLNPIKEKTNTQYKKFYRKLIKFEYTEAIVAVKDLVNFYEPNLIEECSCGKEYFYEVSFKDKD